jgi:hypothetical protein
MPEMLRNAAIAVAVVAFAVGWCPHALAQPGPQTYEPPASAATGPIEDTSYSAQLPGTLRRLWDNSTAWARYSRESPVFTLVRLTAGVEVAHSHRPVHIVGAGHADFMRGYDFGAAGTVEERPTVCVGFRYVGFSPGRSAMVKALADDDATARTLTRNPTADWLNDRGRAVVGKFVKWSEGPRVALFADWTAQNGGTDRSRAGVAAAWLRPLGSSTQGTPAGIDLSVAAPFVESRPLGSPRTSGWDPMFGLTVRDQVFRLKEETGAEATTWHFQVGGAVGVRNELNAHAPIQVFVRLKFAPGGKEPLTPREIASRTQIVTLQARRNSAREWLYAAHVTLLQ